MKKNTSHALCNGLHLSRIYFPSIKSKPLVYSGTNVDFHILHRTLSMRTPQCNIWTPKPIILISSDLVYSWLKLTSAQLIWNHARAGKACYKRLRGLVRKSGILWMWEAQRHRASKYWTGHTSQWNYTMVHSLTHHSPFPHPVTSLIASPRLQSVRRDAPVSWEVLPIKHH